MHLRLHRAMKESTIRTRGDHPHLCGNTKASGWTVLARADGWVERGTEASGGRQGLAPVHLKKEVTVMGWTRQIDVNKESSGTSSRWIPPWVWSESSAKTSNREHMTRYHGTTNTKVTYEVHMGCRGRPARVRLRGHTVKTLSFVRFRWASGPLRKHPTHLEMQLQRTTLALQA